jgi:hypothetical protein
MWIAVASTAAVAWLAYEIITAPEGRETPEGYGPIPSDQFPQFPQPAAAEGRSGLISPSSGAVHLTACGCGHLVQECGHGFHVSEHKS